MPREWAITGFGLDLATFKPMIGTPEPKTGAAAPATFADTLLKEGEGQRAGTEGETISTGDEPARSEDALTEDDSDT